MWAYIRRNKAKIVAGGAVITSSVYGLKKAADFLKDKQIAENLNSFNYDILRQRKRFIFDGHQESCDKLLINIIADVKKIILEKFNCEELVERLKTQMLNEKEKIKIWRELQLLSVARILATAHCYALTIVTFKLQKTILCRDLCIDLDIYNKEISQPINWTEYIKSFFIVNEKPTSLENFILTTDSDVQKLFNNSITYFMEEGLGKFCDKIKDSSNNILSQIPLTQKFNSGEVIDLTQNILNESDIFNPYKNFSQFIVPDSRPVISLLADRSVRLQKLLRHLINAIESDDARELLYSFTKLLLELKNKTLKEKMKNEKIAFAKIIPIITDIFYDISSYDDHSVFQQILLSTPLYHFILKEFNDLNY